VTTDLRGQHDLGEIVGYAWQIYARNFRPLFLIALLTMPMQLLIGVIQQRFDSDGGQVAAQLLQLPAILVGVIASGALVFAVNEITAGTPGDFSRSLDAVFAKLGTVIKSALLAGILALTAMLAFPFLAIYWFINRNSTVDGRRDWWMVLIPFALAVYLALRWAFSEQAVMIDDRRNWSALDLSAYAVRGAWWRTLGILLIISMIQAGPIVMASFATLLPPLPSATITSAVFALVLPFPVIAQTLLYYDLKARKRQPDVTAAGVPPAGSDVSG
jgi:hypothetical protein